MLSRPEFLDIAREALDNPRTGHYDVRELSDSVRAYPFQTEEGAIPAIAVQFAVENRFDKRAKRVITIATSERGTTVWCGDRFTQGELPDDDARERVEDALLQLAPHVADSAVEDMLETQGSYRYSAPCHFWKAWYSHRGVCKHVAAVFQHVQAFYIGGVEGLVDTMDEAYEALMQSEPPLAEHEGLCCNQSKTEARGELMAFVASLAAPQGGLTPQDYGRLSTMLDNLAS